MVYLLPNVYSSKATILIERPDTYANTGTQVVSDNLSQRMHAIIATVMSTPNIQRIIKDHELVEPDAELEDIAAATEDFRDKAQLLFDNVAVINRFTGKQGMYSRGMTVEFEHSDPDVAYAVTKKLTDHVLQANTGKGEDSAAYRREALTSETAKLSKELTAAEKKVAQFKEANALYLPELRPAAIRRLDDLESQRQRAEETRSRLLRDAATNRTLIATAAPDAILYGTDGRAIQSPKETLRLLELEYATKSAKYSSSHPEIRKLRAELEALRGHVNGSNTAGLELDLRKARQDLATAKQRYSDAHPNVKKLQSRVNAISKTLRDKQRANGPRDTSTPNSPEYNRLLAQQEATQSEISRESERLSALERDTVTVREQLSKMPFVEQQLSSLERIRLNAETAYRDVQAQLSTAERGFELLEADLLDRFNLIEEPVRAFKPSAPRRELLLPVLGLLCFGLGLLVVLLKHALQDRICRSDELEAIIDAPVLLVPEFRLSK